MTTLFSSSTMRPPKPHRIVCVQPLPSPTAWPSAMPSGWPVALQLLGAFEDLLRVGGEFLEARLVDPGLAIDHARAGGAERQADPLAVAHAVFLRRVVPAAIFVAEIVGEVGQRHELVGILVRVVVPAENDVGAGADIRGDRRLRPDVLPGFRLELHRDAGRLGEFLRVGEPLVLVALHELVPAQHAQARAVFRREGRAPCLAPAPARRAAARRRRRRSPARRLCAGDRVWKCS